MLHRSCDFAIVEDNVVYDNGEAGIAIYESSYCTVQHNTCENNMCEFANILYTRLR